MKKANNIYKKHCSSAQNTNFAAGLQTKTTNIMMEIMIILWIIGVLFGASQGRK